MKIFGKVKEERFNKEIVFMVSCGDFGLCAVEDIYFEYKLSITNVNCPRCNAAISINSDGVIKNGVPNHGYHKMFSMNY